MATDIAIAARTPDAADVVKRALESYDIPASLHAGLLRYLLGGIRPGSFLNAVLENDLQAAVLRASHDENLLAVRQLVLFLHNEVPGAVLGNARDGGGMDQLSRSRSDRAMRRAERAGESRRLGTQAPRVCGVGVWLRCSAPDLLLLLMIHAVA